MSFTPREIKRLRGALGMTQAEFALLVHAHAGTVSRWETGHLAPDQWQQQIMERLKEAVRLRPDAADEAKSMLAAGAVGLALGLLLVAVLREEP